MMGKLVEWECWWNVKIVCVYREYGELIMKWNNIEIWYVMETVL